MNLILNGNEELTMSSREIAELTEKEHSNVKRDISAMILQMNYPELKLKDCPVFDPSELKGHEITIGQFRHANNLYDEFKLSHNYTILLVSGYNVNLRMNIIKRWQELESKQSPQLPQTMSQALQLAADQAKQLEEQAPKIEYHDKVLSTANGLTTTEIASELNMSAIKLNRLLKDSNVQRKIGSRWVLTVSAMGNEYTTENTHITDDGKTRHSMKWTEKGRKFIHELITPIGG
tara:strand:- start:4970 stop:5671 length:702 start_codon:yes stop_codon:yes gene_type:complete